MFHKYTKWITIFVSPCNHCICMIKLQIVTCIDWLWLANFIIESTLFEQWSHINFSCNYSTCFINLSIYVTCIESLWQVNFPKNSTLKDQRSHINLPCIYYICLAIVDVCHMNWFIITSQLSHIIHFIRAMVTYKLPHVNLLWAI